MALLSVADALALVLADAVALPAEAAALVDACGRVLAGDVVALRTQPPADVSAMDGYAVRAADVAAAPVHLAVVGEVAAGRPFNHEIGPGEAARIFTGGVMPRGADTVVIQEIATREGDAVAIKRPETRGRYVRPEGFDFKAGAVLLAEGRRLTARDIALAGAMNHATLPVHRRPRMAVLATGDELVAPGTPPAPGQIRAGAHTDYGAVTILLPDNVPGLQVLGRGGAWLDVSAPPSTFVCNIGDLMQHWTNDRWISTMHRVVNPPREAAAGNRRLSIPFFHQPNYDALIECLPTCCGPDNPARYEAVTSGQHRLTKFLRGVGAVAPGPRG